MRGPSSRFPLRAPGPAADGTDVSALESTPPFLASRTPRGVQDAPEIPGFRLRSRIGSGPHGDVFVATQKSPVRVVALKVLRPAGRPETFRLQFEEWLLEVQRLKHRCLVNILGGGFAGDHAFVTMEFIDGPSLWEKLENGALPPAEALSLTRQVLESVVYLHAKGGFHGDLRPSNILLDPAGNVRVSDPGLALRFEDLLAVGPVNAPAPGVREWAYHAPGRREHRRWFGRHADLYSVGAFLYHVSTGELPVLGSATAGRPPPRVDPCLPRLLRKLLSRDPAQRFLSAREALTEVETVEKELADPARPRSLPAEAAEPPVFWSESNVAGTPVVLYETSRQQVEQEIAAANAPSIAASAASAVAKMSAMFTRTTGSPGGLKRWIVSTWRSLFTASVSQPQPDPDTTRECHPPDRSAETDT